MTRICHYCHQRFPETAEYFGHTPSGGFRNKCRLCVRSDVKKHSEKRPDLVAERVTRRQKQQKEQATTPITAADRERIKFRLRKIQSDLCFYCQKKLSLGGELDHRDPISKGGLDNEANMVLACYVCNKEKHNKTVSEYRNWILKTGRKPKF